MQISLQMTLFRQTVSRPLIKVIVRECIKIQISNSVAGPCWWWHCWIPMQADFSENRSTQTISVRERLRFIPMGRFDGNSSGCRQRGWTHAVLLGSKGIFFPFHCRSYTLCKTFHGSSRPLIKATLYGFTLWNPVEIVNDVCTSVGTYWIWRINAVRGRLNYAVFMQRVPLKWTAIFRWKSASQRRMKNMLQMMTFF